MKKLIFSMALVIGLGSLASAQTKERKHIAPQQRAEIRSKKLAGELKLTADQSAKVNAILLAQANSLDSLRTIKSTEKGDKRAAVRNIMQNTDNRLNTVLTADQQKAYAQLKADGKKRFKDGKGNFKAHAKKTPQQRAEMLTGKLKEKLNLSADQTTKVNSILLARASKVDSIRTANSSADKKQNRGAFKGIFKDTDAQLNAVLNADQQKAYADWKAEHKKHFKNKRADKTQG
ncbi:hypothetical protein EOD41_19135 [Mucilaginibacter limnophilus]|uniref:DUF4890 domain-containing protein n=1 Tax=Mucilaginibacter limnophilus TaxID=1932778 RepID=A0A3S2UIW7_9SPHI|nr:hypothetical protein [Mucilaginibacter limnophilus]RVT97280.1 hypothetical protein EOD41_19135 [Mucilaginibacter limnophilus]